MSKWPHLSFLSDFLIESLICTGCPKLKRGNALDGTWGRHLAFHKPEVPHLDYRFVIGYIIPTILCGTFDIPALSKTVLICADVFYYGTRQTRPLLRRLITVHSSITLLKISFIWNVLVIISGGSPGR